jgi:ubiquinone/menaquinone biosynthesis C-methylase UbiE
MRTLDQIATELGTDKASFGHNYVEKYERHLSEYRDKNFKLLEIGIDKGYSIKMWKEFFPKADIHAIDIVDKTEYAEDRVNILVGSQNDVKFLEGINKDFGPFDVIIDDGSHINEDMTISFVNLFPVLKPGGLYIVEDLHACYWPWVQKNVDANFTNVIKQLLDHTNSSGKSGQAERKNDYNDTVVTQRLMGDMGWWDTQIESITLYRSIVFIKKHTELA